MIVVGWLFVLVVIASAQNATEHRLPAWMRVWGNSIGDRSYAIFLLHLPVFAVSWAIGQLVGVADGYWQWPVFQLVTSMLMLVPLVEVVYRRIELPMIARGKRAAEHCSEAIAVLLATIRWHITAHLGLGDQTPLRQSGAAGKLVS